MSVPPVADAANEDGLRSKDFIEGAKEQLRGHLALIRQGGFDDAAVREAYIGNVPVLLFLVILMDYEDPELIKTLVDLLYEMCTYTQCIDALLRTHKFPSAFRKLRESARARAPDCKEKTRRIHRALRRRGLGLGLEETPIMDLSNHKFERMEDGALMVTPPPRSTPVRFINIGNKSRQVTLKIDGIVDEADKEEIKQVLVEVLGVVSIYFDSMHEDRVNVRIRHGTSPDMLAKAVSAKGPYAVHLVVKSTINGQLMEDLVLLDEGKSVDDSYLPDQTVIDHDDRAPVPISSENTGGSSWSIFSKVSSFIRRPFW